MPIIVNIGNQTTSFGIFLNNTEVILSTKTKDSCDYLDKTLPHILQEKNLSLTSEKAIIISVVEELSTVYKKTLDKLTQKQAYIVTPNDFPFLEKTVDSTTVGADRLMNAFYASQVYKKNTVIIDLGTATTFDIINEQGHFIGGIITPGIQTMLSSLFSHTNKIKDISLTPSLSLPIIGKNTHEAIHSGLFHGHAALVNGMIEKIENSLSVTLKKIATGGWASSLIPLCQHQIEIQTNLTLSSGLLLASFL